MLMKSSVLLAVCLLIFIVCVPAKCSAQIKEAAQLSTLSPSLLVIYSSEMESYQKHHFLISTIGYMGSYMVLDSEWKAALLTLVLGATKEVVIDGLMGRGEPLWNDMMWNSLGVGQGVLFTITLRF